MAGDPYIAAVTIGELVCGARRLADGQSRTPMHKMLPFRFGMGSP